MVRSRNGHQIYQPDRRTYGANTTEQVHTHGELTRVWRVTRKGPGEFAEAFSQLICASSTYRRRPLGRRPFPVGAEAEIAADLINAYFGSLGLVGSARP